MLVFCLVAVALVSYFLGAVNGAIIMSKNIFRKDIREYGSGNAGLTNAYRVFGKSGVALVLIIDIGKAALSVFFGWLLIGAFGHHMVGKIYACFFVMLGHVFPIYYGFRGGKGVLAFGISAFMIDWKVGLICWAVFLLIVILTRYVSLGSMIAAVVFPLMTGIFGGWYMEVLLSVMCALLLIIKHYDNILRLIARKESKFNLKKEKSG